MSTAFKLGERVRLLSDNSSVTIVDVEQSGEDAFYTVENAARDKIRVIAEELQLFTGSFRVMLDLGKGQIVTREFDKPVKKGERIFDNQTKKDGTVLRVTEVS